MTNETPQMIEVNALLNGPNGEPLFQTITIQTVAIQSIHRLKGIRGAMLHLASGAQMILATDYDDLQRELGVVVVDDFGDTLAADQEAILAGLDQDDDEDLGLDDLANEDEDGPGGLLSLLDSLDEEEDL